MERTTSEAPAASSQSRDETEETVVVLTTVHPRSDGRVFAKQARSLASSLATRVVLVVSDGRGDELVDSNLSIKDVGAVGGGRLGRALRAPWRAFWEIRSISPHVVHFHDPELIPLGFVLSALGIKVIYDIHEDMPRQILTKHWLPELIRRPIAGAVAIAEWMASRSFAAVVPATPIIASRFPAAKTTTVQNYPILGAPPSRVADRTRPTFVYPGAIADIRGAVEMVMAIDRLGEERDARLVLAGGFSPPEFSEVLRQLPGWRFVDYRGFVAADEVGRILSTASAGLVVHHPVPNEIDAQPVKMYEYMAAGLPIIASDFPEWRPVIDGCGCGILVDPLDPDQIAQAMRWILDNPNEAEQMGQRGRSAVEQEFNWDSEASKLVGLYRRLLGAPGK